jgi:heterodisulfide reductase subunit C
MAKNKSRPNLKPAGKDTSKTLEIPSTTNPSTQPPTPCKGVGGQLSERSAGDPKLTGSTPIQAHEFDPHFKYEIAKMHGGEKLKQCFQCGTCTSDCPVARFSDSYRPRHIIRMAQLGLRNRVLSSDTLWLCASCFTCTDRCPQDVEVASVIRILRNAAAKQGFIPSIFKELGSNILETGIAYCIPELRLKKREQIGLPPLPKGNSIAIVSLARAVGFYKTLGRSKEA